MDWFVARKEQLFEDLWWYIFQYLDYGHALTINNRNRQLSFNMTLFAPAIDRNKPIVDMTSRYLVFGGCSAALIMWTFVEMRKWSLDDDEELKHNKPDLFPLTSASLLLYSWYNISCLKAVSIQKNRNRSRTQKRGCQF